MTHYCLGFAFTDHDNFVVLIRKNKPAWQKGLLNGVGGKVEENEPPRVAMAREFREETGIVTKYEEWRKFTEMRFTDAVVHCYAVRLAKGRDNFCQMTDEQVGLFSMIDVRNHPKIIPNLRWLIPMALHKLDNDDNEVPHTLDHE